MRLTRDIRVLEVSHGHEESPKGTIFVPKSCDIEYVKPSKVEGSVVIRFPWEGKMLYVRVSKGSVACECTLCIDIRCVAQRAEELLLVPDSPMRQADLKACMSRLKDRLNDGHRCTMT